MDDLLWGLMMMVVGMGVVFSLLAVLMGVLMLIGRLDRPTGEEEPDAAGPAAAPLPPPPVTRTPDAAPVIRVHAGGLTDDDLAAIAIAVSTHAEHRRRLAAPETRAHAPGSQLWASRWLTVGRSLQNRPFTRS